MKKIKVEDFDMNAEEFEKTLWLSEQRFKSKLTEMKRYRHIVNSKMCCLISLVNVN